MVSLEPMMSQVGQAIADAVGEPSGVACHGDMVGGPGDWKLGAGCGPVPDIFQVRHPTNRVYVTDSHSPEKG